MGTLKWLLGMMLAAPVYLGGLVLTILVFAPLSATHTAFKKDGPVTGVVIFFLSTWFYWFALWMYIESQ